MKKFDSFKKNLSYTNDDIYSYNTKVAIIEKNIIIQLAYYSVTTQKHLLYAARQLNLPIMTTKLRNE